MRKISEKDILSWAGLCTNAHDHKGDRQEKTVQEAPARREENVTCELKSQEEEILGTVQQVEKSRKHAEEKNGTSGQQEQGDASSASAAPSGPSGTNHAQSAGGAAITGTTNEGEGDQTPLKSGLPSRLPSQCEVSESDERNVDKYEMHFQQEEVSSLSLDDDDDDDSPLGIVGGGEPVRIMCRDLEDFQAACHTDTQGMCFTYLRESLIKGEQYGPYCPGREYTKERPLGRGGVGRVFRATDNKSGIHFAVKEISPSRFLAGSRVSSSSGDLNKFFFGGELNGLLLSHKNIMPVYGAHLGPEDSADCGAIFSLFQEYVPETVTLDTAMEEQWAWHPDDIVLILHQLLDACCYMHKRGVTHHDIHGRNILINENLNIFLIDWGKSVCSNLPDEEEDFKNGEATDIEQVVAFVSRLHRELRGQRSIQKDKGRTGEDLTLNVIRSFLSIARGDGKSHNTLTAAALLGKLDRLLQENDIQLEEIVNKTYRHHMPATPQEAEAEELTSEDEGQEVRPWVQDPVEDLANYGESEGAVRENNIQLEEIVSKIHARRMPATPHEAEAKEAKLKDEGQEVGPLAQEPDEDLSNYGESEGAVGGTGCGVLGNDEDTVTSAFSTFDQNFFEFEQEEF